MKVPLVKCVVFDVDDTLYLERHYVRSGFRAVGRWLSRVHGTTGFSRASWVRFQAGERGQVFNSVLRSFGWSAGDISTVVPDLVKVYRSHSPQISLGRGARSLLERLADTVRISGITDGPRESQRAKANALGLWEHLKPLIITEEFGPSASKPSLLPFRIVELVTGFSGSECVYVADNPAKDFQAPARLGWRSVRVRLEGGLHCDVPSGKDVELDVETLDDAASALGL